MQGPESTDGGSTRILDTTNLQALSQDDILDIFHFYSNFGRSAVMTVQDSMDSFMFMKFARECPDLLEKRRLTRIDIDLIFTKAKPKYERRLDFEHFLDALSAIAEKKYPEYTPADGLRLLISNHLAPLHELVVNEMQKTGETEVPLTGIFKRLYDVRNYTGVYAERFRSGDGRINGESDNRVGKSFRGNTNTGTDEIIRDISVLMRPELKSGSMTSRRPFGSPTNSRRSPSPRSRQRSASPRSRTRTSRSFNSSTGPSLAATMSPIHYRPNVTAPVPPSKHHNSSANAVQPPVLPAQNTQKQNSSNGRSFKAQAKELLAALEKAQSGGNPAELKRLVEEMTNALQQSSNQNDSEEKHLVKNEVHERGENGTRLANLDTLQENVDLDQLPVLTQEEIQDIFHFYANFGRTAVMTVQDGIDSFMFMKFARECPGLLDRDLNRVDIDLIFTKAKPKYERRISFTHFLDALSAIAEKKYPEYAPTDGLRLLIGNHLVPHYNLVVNEMQKTGETEVPLTGIFKRLYDVRNYTGVYAERFRSGDGRINGESDNRVGKSFRGNTNTGTDEIIRDISVLMRPELRSGSMTNTRSRGQGGSPRRIFSPSHGRRAISPPARHSYRSFGRNDFGRISSAFS